jgi:hypothetical protein
MEALALLADIGLGWKSLPGTKGIAYLVSSSVTKKKKFYNVDSRLK